MSAERSEKQEQKKEYYHGTWNGRKVKFNRDWNGHHLTDGECRALCNGDAVTFRAKSKRTGRAYMAKGMLSEQEFQGRKFVGFGLCMVPEGVYVYDETKLDPRDRTPEAGDGSLTKDEEALFSGSVGRRQDTGRAGNVKDDFGLRSDPGVSENQMQYPSGSSDQQRQGFSASSDFVFDEAVKAKRSAGDVAKTAAKGALGAAAVAGLAGTAAGVSAVKKSKKKTDQIIDDIADDAGFLIGSFFGSTEGERRAVQKAVQGVTGRNSQAVPPPRRRMPDLPNMDTKEQDEPEME